MNPSDTNTKNIEARRIISECLSRAYYNGLDRKGWSEYEEKEGIDTILSVFNAKLDAIEKQAVHGTLQCEDITIHGSFIPTALLKTEREG